jgi:hypothetical protein
LHGHFPPELPGGKINPCLFVRSRTMPDAPPGRHARRLPPVFACGNQQSGKVPECSVSECVPAVRLLTGNNHGGWPVAQSEPSSLSV